MVTETDGGAFGLAKAQLPDGTVVPETGTVSMTTKVTRPSDTSKSPELGTAWADTKTDVPPATTVTKGVTISLSFGTPSDGSLFASGPVGGGGATVGPSLVR